MSATTQAASPLQIFYDGACPLCRREAKYYRGKAPAGAATFIDIAAPDFDAAAHALDSRAINKEIHARKADGTTVTGIDALALMWQLVPHTRWLARLTTVPGVRQAMQMGYIVFARLRPHLPGRTACDTACIPSKPSPNP